MFAANDVQDGHATGTASPTGCIRIPSLLSPLCWAMVYRATYAAATHAFTARARALLRDATAAKRLTAYDYTPRVTPLRRGILRSPLPRYPHNGCANLPATCLLPVRHGTRRTTR